MTALNDYKDWVLRVFYYFIFCGTVAAIPYIIFSKSNLSHTDVDSARYMLSALIQSEAAIIAIVVTMSLVAVQLAASSYSVRVVDIFRKKPDLWLLLLTYGIAIFWGLGVLKMIDTKNPLLCELLLFCQSNLESYIVFTYSLGVFVYVALAVYIWHMMGMLNPSTIIDTLAKDITKKNIFNKEAVNENDPMLPIIDIVNNSVRKYDHVTSKAGLSAIEERIAIILENDLNEDEEINISQYILDHLTRIGKLALSRDDEYAIIQVTNTILKIGSIAVEKERKTLTLDALDNLGYIGIDAAKRNLEWSTRMALLSIVKIGEVSIENECDIQSKEGVLCLESITKMAVEHQLQYSESMVSKYIALVGIKAAKYGLKETTFQAVLSIENIGLDAIKKEMGAGASEARKSLNSMRKNIPSELKSEILNVERALREMDDALEKASTASKNKQKSPRIINLIITNTK